MRRILAFVLTAPIFAAAVYILWVHLTGLDAGENPRPFVVMGSAGAALAALTGIWFAFFPDGFSSRQKPPHG